MSPYSKIFQWENTTFVNEKKKQKFPQAGKGGKENGKTLFGTY